MPDRRNIGALLLTQGTRPDLVEDRLLREDLVRYRPAPSTTPNQNSVNISDLGSGLRAFHKPLRGVKLELASIYGHEAVGVSLNECAAWRVARFLGAPYDEMVPVTVLRYHEADSATTLQYPWIADGWGSFASEKPGISLDPTPFATPDLNDAAAFFDALIAQQDRHLAQYRWEQEGGLLGLIDHGFAFARPGDPFNDSLFVRQRHAEGREQLDELEQESLERVERADLVGLRDILDPGQADAFEDRIKRMRRNGRLPAPGEW
jgi:hypothetical protein